MKRIGLLLVMLILLVATAVTGCPSGSDGNGNGGGGTQSPAAFSLSNLSIEPTEVGLGETVAISVSVDNTGGSQGTHDVVLKINGAEEETKSVTLAAGDSEDVSFSVTRGDAGTYAVTVEDLSGSFTVVMFIASIKIEATTSTWREGEEPYDIYGAIESELASVGIKVVSEAGEPYDALLSVEYKETTGGIYIGGGYGTNIRCSLKLRDNTGRLLYEKTISASTPNTVMLSGNQTLYSVTLGIFRSEFYFRYLGEVIATKFGVGDEVSILISALNDRNYAVRDDAVIALGKIGDARAVEALIQALLENENSDVRGDVAKTLGEIGDTRAVEALIQAWLEDEDLLVRMNAVVALGEIGDARAVEALTQALEDESSTVRSRAAEALEKIQGE